MDPEKSPEQLYFDIVHLESELRACRIVLESLERENCYLRDLINSLITSSKNE